MPLRKEEYEEDESDEECVCECFDEECKCECECEDCDQDWTPGIDEYDDDTESDYDSDDSMDYVYEECGLDRKEKKMLQEQLRLLEEQAIMGTIPEEEEQEDPHPAK